MNPLSQYECITNNAHWSDTKQAHMLKVAAKFYTWHTIFSKNLFLNPKFSSVINNDITLSQQNEKLS